MDGRGRLLRSVSAPEIGLPPAAIASAGALVLAEPLAPRRVMVPPRRHKQRALQKAAAILTAPGAGAPLSVPLSAVPGPSGSSKAATMPPTSPAKASPPIFLQRRSDFLFKP